MQCNGFPICPYYAIRAHRSNQYAPAHRRLLYRRRDFGAYPQRYWYVAGISTNLEAVTAQYVDVRLERKRRCWKPTTRPYTRKRPRPKRTQPARTPPRKQKREATEWSCEGRISLQLHAAFYMFLGNPGTIRAPQHTFLQNGLHTAIFAGHHRKQGKGLENVVFSRLLWRRRWDSNPRALADYLISSQARYDHFDTSP